MSVATIEVRYPEGKGSIGLRGSLSPLSWTETRPCDERTPGTAVFRVIVPPGEVLEFKPMRNGTEWSQGRNETVLSGETLVIEPYFDRKIGTLDPALNEIPSAELGRSLSYRVFLPPSYDEHQHMRYPVLYAQDGQSLFGGGPGGSWQMDDALNELYDLSAVEEVIVVAVHTDEGRLEMLSPTPDPRHGGGDGPSYLKFLAETLKDAIDTRYRTRRGREDTAVIGSSMGGLFSFFAAWTRPDVFGKAACLSSSFWWDDRSMVREVQKGECPYPRPQLYIDSGAAISPFAEDANVRDGYQHTIALRKALIEHCYIPGSNIHTLAFAGMSHDNASWAARLAIPLQLLFPRR
ncbi:MAG: alpha/beta hydrolase-fold protein [Thermoanaerobaculia bacterium]